MAAPTPVKLGPGTLVLGETGTEQDASCLVQNAVVSWEVDTEDDLQVLCGDTVAGARTYSATLSGTILEDLDQEAGMVAYSWANKGTQVQAVFVPNTEAGATVTGTLTIDPLDVGGDEYGSVMTADFEWSYVGEPELTWAAAPPAGASGTTAKKAATKAA